MVKNKVIKLNASDFDIKDRLPEKVFIGLKNAIKNDQSILETDVSFLDYPELTKTIFEVSDDQFRELFDIYVDLRVKKSIRSESSYIINNYFCGAESFFNLNANKLANKENLLYILEKWVELFHENRDIILSESIISLPSSTDLRYGYGYCDTFKLAMKYPEVKDFIQNNYDAFLLYYEYGKGGIKELYFAPEILESVIFDVSFVREKYQYFLPPAYARNPASHNTEIQTIIFGPMTENFINTIYKALSPNLPKIEITTDDIVASIIAAM